MSDATRTIMREAPIHLVQAVQERHPTLLVLCGPDAGRTMRLESEHAVLGRGDGADVSIQGDGVSRRHVGFMLRASGCVFACDLGSTNGTLVNGQPVDASPRALLEGDRIQVGEVVLKFTYRDTMEDNLQQSLYTAAVRDGLTGAYNKRYFMDRMEQEFAWSQRHGQPLALVMYDLDHFKRVNDTWGHLAGDEVLRVTSRGVLGSIRKEDIFARIGGEEFAVMMRETGIESAMVVARRIADCIARAPIRVGEDNLMVTASIGVTSSRCGRFESPMEMHLRADRLLYDAKGAGRNCIRWDVEAEAPRRVACAG